MFTTFILVLFYRYDRVTTSLWIRYHGILLGEGLQLASVRLQIILWLRNANTYISIGSNKYDLVIVDDYSRFAWVFFLQNKSETQEVLKKFLRRAQNEFDARVKKIRSDNNIEFKNTQVEDFLDE
jgi:hypothetical protein